jgi:hypothetical protein
MVFQSDGDLQLAATKAFLGLIRPAFRRVAATRLEHGFAVTVLLDPVDEETLSAIKEDVSVATTEIAADMPAETALPINIVENVQPISGPLPAARADGGLIFERWEVSR